MEKFEIVFDKWSKVNNELRQACEEYLEKILSKVPNQHIDIDCDECLAVPYDGGSHPEYDSNCFSMVLAIHMDEKEDIYLDIEDADNYSIDNINADSLFDIARAVKRIINTEYRLIED